MFLAMIARVQERKTAQCVRIIHLLWRMDRVCVAMLLARLVRLKIKRDALRVVVISSSLRQRNAVLTIVKHAMG
jgi:hypothetical protein